MLPLPTMPSGAVVAVAELVGVSGEDVAVAVPVGVPVVDVGALEVVVSAASPASPGPITRECPATTVLDPLSFAVPVPFS